MCEVNENFEEKQEIKTCIKHSYINWGTQLYLIKRSGMEKLLNVKIWPDNNYENTLVADYGIYQACNTLCIIPSFVIQNYEDEAAIHHRFMINKILKAKFNILTCFHLKISCPILWDSNPL